VEDNDPPADTSYAGVSYAPGPSSLLPAAIDQENVSYVLFAYEAEDYQFWE
jgi:hypothetical protein